MKATTENGLGMITPASIKLAAGSQIFDDNLRTCGYKRFKKLFVSV